MRGFFAQFLPIIANAMRMIDPTTAKRALSNYIRGLLQDFTNETGQHVEQLNITYALEDNRRIVKEVEVITRVEVPEFI